MACVHILSRTEMPLSKAKSSIDLIRIAVNRRTLYLTSERDRRLSFVSTFCSSGASSFYCHSVENLSDVGCKNGQGQDDVLSVSRTGRAA